MDRTTLTIASLHEGFRKKEFSAREIIEDYCKAIAEKDPSIGAYLEFYRDEALEHAETVDARIASGEALQPLEGVPFALKDNIVVEGHRTTAGSRILEGYIGAYNATVTNKVLAAHAIVLGKTNLDEFAMGSSTEHSAFQKTTNPFDETRVPGGSSGGSAAAVGGNLALVALGSDTGGSIRQPAAFCGVVGLKPTYGAVSRFGLIALASSLDQIGPCTKTVRDAATVFNAIVGCDDFDATSSPNAQAGIIHTQEKTTKLCIGIPKEYFSESIDPAVASGIEEAKRRLSSLGFTFKEVSLPNTKYALSVYYIIMPAEASANLARFDGIRYARLSDAAKETSLLPMYLKNRGKGFGIEPRRRVLLGTFVLSSGYYDAYYAKAQKVRTLIAQDFERAFENVDLLFAPTTPTPAFKFGEKIKDPLAMYLSDIFTIPANLAGLPAISIPIKKYELGGKELPVGFQLIGKRFHESDLLSVGALYEKG